MNQFFRLPRAKHAGWWRWAGGCGLGFSCSTRGMEGGVLLVASMAWWWLLQGSRTFMACLCSWLRRFGMDGAGVGA